MTGPGSVWLFIFMFHFEFSLKYFLFKGVRHVHIFRLDCVSPKSMFKLLKPVEVVFNPLNVVFMTPYRQQINTDIELGYRARYYNVILLKINKCNSIGCPPVGCFWAVTGRGHDRCFHLVLLKGRIGAAVIWSQIRFWDPSVAWVIWFSCCSERKEKTNMAPGFTICSLLVNNSLFLAFFIFLSHAALISHVADYFQGHPDIIIFL